MPRDAEYMIGIFDVDRPVKIGAPYGDGFVLLEGPVAGTRVVREPPEGLSDGQKIKERTDR